MVSILAICEVVLTCDCISPAAYDPWSSYDEYGVLVQVEDDIENDYVNKEEWIPFGSYCYPWHLQDSLDRPANSSCSENEFGEGKHCCQSFCFVKEECSSRIPYREQYVSFDACPDNAPTLESCPFYGNVYGNVISRAPSACACRGINEGMPLKFGPKYGRWCYNWDKAKCHEWWDPSPDKSLTLQAVQPGSWCCEHWCYVSEDCGDAKPSYLVRGLFFSYASCENNIEDIYYCEEPDIGTRLERRSENVAHALGILTLSLLL